MAERKPLVIINGEVKRLPDGDTLPGGGSIPFYKEDGTSDTIALTSSSEIPFFKEDGTQDNIALVV